MRLLICCQICDGSIHTIGANTHRHVVHTQAAEASQGSTSMVRPSPPRQSLVAIAAATMVISSTVSTSAVTGMRRLLSSSEITHRPATQIDTRHVSSRFLGRQQTEKILYEGNFLDCTPASRDANVVPNIIHTERSNDSRRDERRQQSVGQCAAVPPQPARTISMWELRFERNEMFQRQKSLERKRAP